MLLVFALTFICVLLVVLIVWTTNAKVTESDRRAGFENMPSAESYSAQDDSGYRVESAHTHSISHAHVSGHDGYSGYSHDTGSSFGGHDSGAGSGGDSGGGNCDGGGGGC